MWENTFSCKQDVIVIKTWKHNGESAGCNAEQLRAAASASELQRAIGKPRAHCRDVALVGPVERLDKRRLLPPKVQSLNRCSDEIKA